MKKIVTLGLAVALATVWSAAGAIAQTTTDNTQSKSESVKEKATETKDTAKEKAADTKESVKEKAADVKDKVKEKVADVKEKVSEKMHRNKTASASASDVKMAQQALRDKGYDPGPIDGVMGPKTQAAVKDFQRAEGLKQTGRLDKTTVARLEPGSPSASPSTAPSKMQRP